MTAVTASPELNFGWRVMADAVRLYPGRVAVIQGENSLTYAELDERIRRAGSLLRQLGVTVGNRVALMFPNDHRFLELMFGAMRIGSVAVPLNIRMGQEALAYVLRDCEARVLAVHAEMADRARDLLERTGQDVELSVVVAGGDGPKSYDELLAAADPALDVVPVTPDTVCLQPYTSGSTGRPKGCLLTHGGQYWNADTTRKIFMLSPEDRALVAVPLYHKNAMICAVKPCLLAGASLVILPHFDPKAVLASVERYRCTYTTGVPAMYRLLLAEGELLSQTDLSSLQFVVCGSAPVSPELMEQLSSRLGVIVLEAYGLTEGGPQVLLNSRFGLRKVGSAGLPLPGCEVRIVDLETGETELPPRAVGELWVRNPGIAAGYHGLPEITRARITADGWLKTGDLAWRDEDGYFFIAGRKDDMIIVSGENVYPKEVEDLLARCPGVRDVCVVPVAHPIKGQVPVAFIVPEPGATLSEQVVKDFFLARGPAYAYPRRVWFLEALPLSGTGKVDRGELARRAQELFDQGGDPGCPK